MRYLLRQQKSEKVAIGPLFLLGSVGDLLVDAARLGQIQASHQGLELACGELWDFRSELFGGQFCLDATLKKSLCGVLRIAKFFDHFCGSSLPPRFFPRGPRRQGFAAPRLPRALDCCGPLGICSAREGRSRREELPRSEERRVGKEGRARWWGDHCKRKESSDIGQR